MQDNATETQIIKTEQRTERSSGPRTGSGYRKTKPGFKASEMKWLREERYLLKTLSRHPGGHTVEGGNGLFQVIL